MKKYVLIGVAILVAGALVAFGPALLGLYRLQQHVTAAAQADEADGGAWPRLADACVLCHGARGQSLNQHYPSLAGQPAPYLTAQLRNYASGQRANPNMGPLAMALSEAEIDSLVNYFARQPASANEFFTPDPGLREKGKRLVEVGGCIACHGEQLMGRDQHPRLAGQGFDYLVKQFDAFASGTRSEATGTMKAIATAASPDDRRAMAAYLAALPPAQQ